MFPFLLAYWVGLKIKYSFVRRKKLQAKVVSVGNITLGGTGKTTVVTSIAKDLSKKRKVAVLSRGYGRQVSSIKYQASEVVIVSDGEKILVAPEEAGDEPYLLARKLEGVPIIVGRNRYESGVFAEKKFNSEIVILDDGFQYWSLDRDLDIVCLDALTDLEDEQLFPLGTLREPLRALKRADLILLTNADMVPRKEIEERRFWLEELCPVVPVIESIFEALTFHLLAEGSLHFRLDFFKDKEVVLLSSIANPFAFEETVKSLGVKIVGRHFFPDHYWYKEKDLTSLSKEKYPIITTEKDEVKIEKIITNSTPTESGQELQIPDLYILEIELRITEGKEIWENILNTILLS